MTIAFVKKNTLAFGDSVTSFSTSLASVTAGDAVFTAATIACGSDTGSGPAAAIPTPTTGSWSVGLNPTGPTSVGAGYKPVQAVFHKLSSAGGTETVGWSSLGTDTYIAVDIVEFSHTGTLALDVTASGNAASGTSLTVGPVTPTAASSLAIANGSFDHNAVTTTGPTTGYTQLGLSDNSVHCSHAAGYKILTSAAATSAAWSGNVSTENSGVLVFYVESGGGGGGGITGAGQIASGEAIGSALVGAGISPAGIASAQAFGSAVIGAGISTTGIATGEAVGTPSIAAGIAVAGVASGEASGSPAVAAAISTTGIASAEAFGLPVVAPAGVIAAGIPSAEAFGAPRLDASISATGIGSAEAFGATTIAAGVAPIGIATGETLGAPDIAAGIAPVAIPGAEAFGAASLAASIQAAGIASGEAFGTPTVQSSGVFPVGIPSAEALGQPALAASINTAGITSGEVFGVPLVGDAPPPPVFRFEMEVDGGVPGRPRRLREANIQPILERMLAKKLPKVKPAAERAAKRAKRIEEETARLLIEGATDAAVLEKLDEWEAERPYVPPRLADIPTLDLFLAQVAFRIEQQAEIDRIATAARRRRQDEDSLLALLLA